MKTIKLLILALLIIFVPMVSSPSSLIPLSIGLVADDVEFVPQPVGPTTSNSTRIAQATYDGAAFFLARPVTFNRVIFRLTAVGVAGNAKILIYQASQGVGGNTASLKATINLAVAASGEFVATPSEGTVTLSQGRIYILFSKDTGTFTYQTRTVQALNLFTAVVDNNTACTSFTTVLAGNTNPATFDPKPTGDATASALDVVLVVRFKKV